MPMELIGKDWVRYVPEFGGNRDEESPASLELQVLRVGEQAELEASVTRAEFESVAAYGVAYMKAVVLAHTRSFEGFEAYGEPVTDPETFHRTAPPNLLSEIVQEIQRVSTLTGTEVKNYELPPLGTYSGDGGTVESAGPKKSNETGTAEDEAPVLFGGGIETL